MASRAAAKKAKKAWAAKQVVTAHQPPRLSAAAAIPCRLDAVACQTSFEGVLIMEDQNWPEWALPSSTQKFYDMTSDDKDLYLSNITRVVKGSDGWHYVKRVVLVRCNRGQYVNVWRHAVVLLPMRKKCKVWRVEAMDLFAGWAQWCFTKDKGGKPVFEWHINENMREVPLVNRKQSAKVYGDIVCGKGDSDCESLAPTEASRSDCRSIGSTTLTSSGKKITNHIRVKAETEVERLVKHAAKNPNTAYLLVHLTTTRVKAFTRNEKDEYRKECITALSSVAPASLGDVCDLRRRLEGLGVTLKEPAWLH